MRQGCNHTLLRRMPEVLILLEKIPVLPCLENLASKTSVSLRGPLDMQPSYSSGKPTLYAWMNAQVGKAVSVIIIFVLGV